MQIDRRTDVTKLTVAYRDFAYTPNSYVRKAHKTVMTAGCGEQLEGEHSRCGRPRKV